MDGQVSVKLLFDKNASYKENLSKITNRCAELKENKKIGYREFESHNLSPGLVADIEKAIRSLKPQRRGSIVATRRYPLPLSNSKKLNLSNTPVLLVESRGSLQFVFPCLLGETYYTINKGLDHLEHSLPHLEPLAGEMEDSIAKRFLSNLESYEKGLTKVGEEIETSAGKADLVLIDKDGRHVVVEFEREATDQALGQILRLCAGYQKKLSLTKSWVRGVIACARIHEFVREAAMRADVEIWRVSQDLQID